MNQNEFNSELLSTIRQITKKVKEVSDRVQLLESNNVMLQNKINQLYKLKIVKP